MVWIYMMAIVIAVGMWVLAIQTLNSKIMKTSEANVIKYAVGTSIVVIAINAIIFVFSIITAAWYFVLLSGLFLTAIFFWNAHVLSKVWEVLIWIFTMAWGVVMIFGLIMGY